MFRALLVVVVLGLGVRLAGVQSGTELDALLERHARGFTLQQPPDDNAPTGVLEFETLRDRKPHGVGVYVKHLASGQEASLRGDVTFETQSVIKLAIMVRAYQLADAGELDLDNRIELQREHMVFGSGVLRRHQPGLRLTVRDLITEMIITSDNTATDLVLGRIGGVASLNRWLRDAGYATTRMGSTAFESFRLPYLLANPAHLALTGPEVMALRSGDPVWGLRAERIAAIRQEVATIEKQPLRQTRAQAAARGLPLFFGQMTPREAGRLLEGIERETIASPVSCREMRNILRSQHLGFQRVPHYLPYEVGHKTGDSYPWDANDVGIVYTPASPIVIAVFTNDLGGTYGEEEDRIGALSRDVVRHFDRK